MPEQAPFVRKIDVPMDRPAPALPLDSAGPAYRPLPFWSMVRRPRDPAHRVLVTVWLVSALLFVPTGMLTRWLEWTGLPLTVGGTDLFLTVYLPLFFCTACVLWLGYAWGAIPAYLSTFCVALVSGMPLHWSLLFSFANPLGLAVYALAYRAIPVRTDLRSVTALSFYVLVAFVAALVGSSGSFVWAYTNDVGSHELMPVWQGWWLGGLVQAVLFNGPLFFLFSPVVGRWKERRGLSSVDMKLARGRLLAAFTVVVLALTGYVILVRHFSLRKLDLALQAFGGEGQAAVWAAVEGLSLIHWVTLLLILTTGVFGYQMLVHWTARLRRLNRQLTGEISERKRIEAQLQEKATQLRLANDSKDRFFSIISHDLRSPLGSILSVARTLEDDFDTLDRDMTREFVHLLHHSTEHLYELLENLLAWARLQTDGMQHQPDTLDLHLLAYDLAGLLRNHAVDKQITLRLDVPEETRAWADPNMMRSVLLNLLSNAIKFTEPGGAVYLTIAREDKGLRVTVRDTGVGMTPTQQARLFQVDTACSTPGTADEKGSGLGLILCHEMVAQHGSELVGESRPGVGTTFSFTLPAHRPRRVPTHMKAPRMTAS